MANLPKTYVYLVTRSDHNDYIDRKGVLHPISIYATQALANDAAKAYIVSESSRVLEDSPHDFYSEGFNKDGLYYGACTWKRLDFKVTVKKMELNGASELLAALSPDENKEQGAGDSACDNGAKNCLSGQIFVFYGTIPTFFKERGMDIIRKYGGKIRHELSGDTSFVVCGPNIGPDLVRRINGLGIKTLDSENQLYSLIGKRPVKTSATNKRKELQFVRGGSRTYRDESQFGPSKKRKLTSM